MNIILTYLLKTNQGEIKDREKNYARTKKRIASSCRDADSNFIMSHEVSDAKTLIRLAASKSKEKYLSSANTER